MTFESSKLGIAFKATLDTLNIQTGDYMKRYFVAMIVILNVTLTTQAAEKPRLPASLDCETPTTEDISGLVYLLNVQGTIKQGRYAQMMSESTNAKTCDEAHRVMLTSIRDCTVKEFIKKGNCKK